MKYGIQKSVTEHDIVDAVESLFHEMGYRVLPELRIRTWRPDIVAVKGGQVVIVEAKGQQSDMRRALAQAALYSTDATAAYLALPRERIRKDVKEAAKVFGIGLIGVEDRAEIELEAVPSDVRESLLNRIRKTRNVSAHPANKRRRTSPSGLDRLLRYRRVLEVLLSRPGRRFTIRELSLETGTSYSTTWRLARDLESLGVVLGERVGPSRVLTPNEQAPIFRELRSLAELKLSPHKLAAREFADRLRDLPDVRRAILFGSVARGEERATSDVDIAVVMEKKDGSTVDRIYEIVEKVQDRTQMKVVPLFVSDAELNAKSRLARSIRSGEILFERS